ncbi:unnamed protein product [Meloidogyne enterolobii]
MLVALPPDLTCNICSGNEKSLSSSNSVSSQENNPNNPPRRKSVGGDVRGGNKEENKTSTYQSGFLFNIKDPIWRPLSEMDVLNPDWSNTNKNNNLAD